MLPQSGQGQLHLHYRQDPAYLLPEDQYQQEAAWEEVLEEVAEVVACQEAEAEGLDETIKDGITML